MTVLPPAASWKVPVSTTIPLLSVTLYVKGAAMSLPLLVITNVAVLVLTPLHTPVALKDGGAGGVLVGVLVGKPVGVTVGVFVGVLVGRKEQDPTELNVTEDRKDVLYITVMVA